MNQLSTKLTRYQDVAALLLRVGVGVIMIAHGASKLAEPSQTVQQFASMGIPLPEVAVVLAILGEFFGGIGLLIGLWTRIAALGPLFTMIFAIAFVHLGHGLFAQNNGWEYPLILALVSLLFVVRGAGAYSLDAWIAKRQTRSKDMDRRARAAAAGI